MDTCGTIIQTRDLCRYYTMGSETVCALDYVNLSILKGLFFGITGASGSGKSTLLYLLGGLDYPTSGQIVVMGNDIGVFDDNQLASFRQKVVGFVYQSFHLIPTMTALENVELPMLLAGVNRRERRRRALELLEIVGLSKRIKHKPAEMSGGQQQRVAIARALTNQPPILLADEPTGNLDSRTGIEIIQLFIDLCHNQQLTIVMVSHDAAAIQATDCYIRMQDGKLLERYSQREKPIGNPFAEPLGG